MEVWKEIPGYDRRAMTPQEKIEDINYFWCINTDIIPSRESAICYAQNDIEWLLKRVKKLEAALETVKNRAVTTNMTNTEIELLVDIARKALEESEE
jgi:hypothetical protein